MTIVIDIEPPDAPDVIALLEYHLAEAHRVSPPEFAFALPIDDLRKATVIFWTARESDELLGFGALKALGDGTGEVKSMRTAPQHLRRGIAACLLETIIAEARNQNYSALYLETGATADFEPARNLYARYGFRFCPPFSDYVASNFNRYMKLEL